MPSCGSHRIISTAEPYGVDDLCLLCLGSNILVPAFFKRECPQTCGKLNDLFSSSINDPKWCHILVGFIFGPWLICTDLCLFPWGFSQHFFFPCGEAMYAFSWHFKVYPAIQVSFLLLRYPSWSSWTPRRKRKPGTSLPSSHTHHRLDPRAPLSWRSPFSGKFYLPRTFFCF